MSDITMDAGAPVRQKRARNWLDISAKTWFVVTAIGQWLFVAFILGYYGPRFFGQGLEGFDGTHLANGFIQGDGIGNTALAIHILVAGLIIAAGQIQLIPRIRNSLPKLHRYSGWFYMIASMVVGGAGLYLVWSRDRVIGTFTQDVGTSLGGVLIFVFVPIALAYAIKRDFAAHRRWALRLFMVVSAVWFLRLIMFAWLITTGGLGVDMKTFTGPFLYFVHFAQYLLPLGMLELYFWAQKAKNKAHRGWVAGSLFFLTAFMAIGIIGISAFLWIPKIGG